MAFNPFRAFRKHSKVLFAGITIVCMLTFVLMAGVPGIRTDFFTSLVDMVSRKRTGADVAKIYGSRVTERDIYQLREQRRVAEQIIQSLVNEGSFKVLGDLSDIEKQDSYYKLPQMDRQLLAQVRTTQLQYLQALNERRQDSMFRLFGPWQQGKEQMRQLQMLLARVKDEAAKSDAPATAMKDEIRLIENALGMIELRQWILDPTFSRFVNPESPTEPELYFGGTLKAESLLDFIMWREQAKRLGIKLKDADVAAVLVEEAFNKVKLQGSAKTDTVLEKILANVRTSDESSRRGTTREWTVQEAYKALGEELAYCLAHGAVLGKESGLRGRRQERAELEKMAVPLTPEDLRQYQLKNLTALKVQFLPVPVSAAEFQTKTQPTEMDLRSLYNQLRDVEYSAESARSGVKVPYQASFSWVGVKSDSPYYRRLAAERLAALEATAYFALAGSDLAPLGTGTGPAILAARACLPFVPDLRVQGEYANARRDLQHWIGNQFSPPTTEQTAATAALLFAAASPAPAIPVWSAPLAAAAHVQAKANDQGRSAAELLFTAADNPLSMAALLQTTVPESQLFSLLRPSLEERVIKEAAHLRAAEDLNKIRTNMDNVRTSRTSEFKAKPKKVAEAMQEWFANDVVLESPTVQVGSLLAAGPQGALPVASLLPIWTGPPALPAARQAAAVVGSGWGHPLNAVALAATKPTTERAIPPLWGLAEIHTTRLYNKYDIAQAPQMKDFVQAYLREEKPDDTQLLDFPNLLFPPQQREMALMLYSPNTLPANSEDWLKKAEEPILYWKADEKEPYTPSFEEAQQRLKDIWHDRKARQQAQAKAKEIAEQISKEGNYDGAIRTLREVAQKHKAWGDLFELDNVSRLVKKGPDLASMPMFPSRPDMGGYAPYALPMNKRDRIRYPDPNLSEELLKSLTKPGEATVVSDRPQEHFYVAVLQERDEPSIERLRALYGEAQFDPTQTSLYSRLYADRQKEYREQVIKQLQVDAGLIAEDGTPKYTLTEEVKKGSGERGEE